jgi:hypothetical protein
MSPTWSKSRVPVLLHCFLPFVTVKVTNIKSICDKGLHRNRDDEICICCCNIYKKKYSNWTTNTQLGRAKHCAITNICFLIIDVDHRSTCRWWRWSTCLGFLKISRVYASGALVCLACSSLRAWPSCWSHTRWDRICVPMESYTSTTWRKHVKNHRVS